MALSSTMVFECQNGGSDTFGGGFNAAGTSPGTDYTYPTGTSAHVVVDGVTITAIVQATTTQLLLSGYTVVSTDNRNTVNITGGTATAGVYEIVAIPGGNIWTLDRSAGTAAQTVVGNMGGAHASPGFSAGKMVTGNALWIKYNATTFDIASTSSNVATGRIAITANTIVIQGYDVTRGDFTGNMPILKCTTNNVSPVVDLSGDPNRINNIALSAGVATGCNGLIMNSVGSVGINIKAQAFSNAYGIKVKGGAWAVNCETTTCSSTQAFQIDGGTLVGCVARANTTIGFGYTNNGTCVKCVSAGNTGAGSHGFNHANATGSAAIECTAYNNGGSGFVSNAQDLLCINCIASDHTVAAKSGFVAALIFNCAAYNNNTDFDANCVSSTPVTLSASPFTNPGGNDFSLNTTVGGGASCRAAGLLGVFPTLISTTGYSDIGAVQHADPAAAGGAGQMTVVGTGQCYLE